MYRASAKPLRRLPLVERLAIPTPCDVSWDGMDGEGSVRHCGTCKKSVYDLRGMPMADADAFLARYVADHRALPCVRLHRRPDGRLLTEPCSRGQARARQRRLVTFASGVVALTVVSVGTFDDATRPILAPDPPFERFEADGVARRAVVTGGDVMGGPIYVDDFDVPLPGPLRLLGRPKASPR